MDDAYGEIKRMFVRPEARGKGIGGQILMALEHRKIVLWMDLGIMETGYVKGEILDSVTKIIAFRDEHGYIPLRVAYVHPKINELPSLTGSPVKLDLISILSTFTEEFLSVIMLIENNFELNTVRPT